MQTLARFLTLLALAGATALAAQGVPPVIHYQGRLTDNTPQQNPLTAAVPMRFVIHDAASAGTNLWQEPAAGGTNVLVVNGIFNVALGGNGVPLPAAVFAGASSTRYLEITLNPGAGNQEILAPRQRIGAAGYAALAQNANAAASATTAGSAITATTANNALALGGVAAANWQRTLVTPACPAGELLKTVNPDGTTLCQAPALSETDPEVGAVSANRVPRWSGAALVDGSLVDTGTNVGIGTAAPAGAFEVGSLAETLDVNVDSATAGTVILNADHYQSFTATTTGQLSRLEIKFSNTAAYSGTLRIYAGNGTGGALLHSQAVTAPIITGFVNFPLSGMPVVTNGSVYTFLLTSGGLTTNRVLNDGNNIYAGGSRDGTVLSDILFNAHVLPAAPLSTLYASGGRVGIGTASPAQKLSVYGHIEVTRAGHGIKFADGSLQTSALNPNLYVLNGTAAQAASFNITGSGTVGGALAVTGNGTVGGTLSVGVRFVTCPVTAATQNCACAAGETLVTGGGFAVANGTDSIRESRPTSATNWRLTCVNTFGSDIPCGGMNILCDRRAT